MAEYDALNVADIFADVVMTGREKPSFGLSETLADGYEIELGNSGPIFGARFSLPGGRFALLGTIGKDLLGDSLKPLVVVKKLANIHGCTAWYNTTKNYHYESPGNRCFLRGAENRLFP